MNPPPSGTGKTKFWRRFFLLDIGWKRVLFRISLWYFPLLVMLWYFQDSFLYHPFREPLSTMQSNAYRLGYSLWPENTENYLGLRPEPPIQNPRGIVVIVHGNAGHALHRHFYDTALRRLGFEVFLYEYPGYGSRPGKLGEQSFVPDLRAAVRRLKAESSAPIYLWGESLGCGVAAAALADNSLPVDGLILLTPWDNLPSLAQARLWIFPAHWMVRDRYDSVANLAHWKKPIAVLLAEHDEIIPIAHGKNLFESLPHPKKRVLFKNAGHNSWPADASQAWWKEVMDFVSSAPLHSRLDSLPRPH